MSNYTTYTIKCGSCLEDGTVATYVGESVYSAHFRGELHQDGLKAEDHRSALWEHLARHHGARPGEGEGLIKNFQMKVTGSYQSSARRLIAEAVQIEREINLRDHPSSESNVSRRARIVLNNKSQWFQPPIIRMQAKTTVEY